MSDTEQRLVPIKRRKKSQPEPPPPIPPLPEEEAEDGSGEPASEKQPEMKAEPVEQTTQTASAQSTDTKITDIPAHERPSQATHLEEMYAYFPELEYDENFFLVIDRLKPESFANYKIKGRVTEKLSVNSSREPWEKFKNWPPSDRDLQVAYGGGRYKVFLFAYHAKFDRPMRACFVDIELPGQPNMAPIRHLELELKGNDTMHNQGDNNAVISMARDMANREREERLEAQRRGYNQQPSQEIVNTITSVSQREVDHAREAAERLVDEHRQRTAVAESRYEKAEQENRELREKLTQAEFRIANAFKESETERVLQLKQKFEDDIRRMAERQAEALERLQREHAERVRELTDRYDRDLREREERSSRDRDRMVAEHDRQLTQIKEDYRLRMEDVVRSYDRDMKNLQQTQSREIESIRSTESVKSQTEQSKAAFQIEFTKTQLATLHSENIRLRSENDELRMKMIKDPQEYLREVTTMAEQLGYQRGGSGGDEDEAKTPYQVMGKIFQSVAENAPEVAKVVMGSLQQREAMRLQAQGVQVPQQPGQQMQQLPPGVRQLSQQVQARRQRLGLPPPAPWEASPPPVGPAVPPAPPPPPAPVRRAPAPPPPPPPPQQQVAQQQPQAQAEPTQQAQSEPQAQPQQQEPQPQQPQTMFAITEAQQQEFLQKLTGAYEGGVVSADMFAQGFVDRLTEELGQEQAMQVVYGLLQNLPIDQFLARLQAITEANNISTPLLSRQGRIYCAEVWEKTGQIVQAFAAAQGAT